MQIRDFPTAHGDLKYYRQLHCQKMKAQWYNPVTYSRFINRLRTMNLHDAINYPRVDYQAKRDKSNTPIQDNIRRMQVCKENNIQILDLEQIDKILFPKPNPMAKNKYNMKPKKSWWNRLLSFFKK